MSRADKVGEHKGKDMSIILVLKGKNKGRKTKIILIIESLCGSAGELDQHPPGPRGSLHSGNEQRTTELRACFRAVLPCASPAC